MEDQSFTELRSSCSISEDLVADQDIENTVLRNLNHLIAILNVKHPRVSSLLHISSDVYPALFEKIFGYQPQDVIKEPRSMEDEAHNIQCVIDTLSLDILGVSLSHITGEDILSRKSLSIYHLLDLISEFGKIRHCQPSPSSESVSLPVSTSSSRVCSSNASHQEHFCPACESTVPKTGSVCKETVLADFTTSSTSLSSDHSTAADGENMVLRSATTTSLSSAGSALHGNVQGTSVRSGSSSLRSGSTSLRSGSTSLRSGSTSLRPGRSLVDSSSRLEKTSSSSTSTESSSITLKSSSTIGSSSRASGKSKVLTAKRRVKHEASFNEKLAEKLAHNLQELKNTLAFTSHSADVGRQPEKSMDELYKSVFQQRSRKRVPTSGKETSVLLPRYLKRRRSVVRIKVTPSKKQKCQSSVQGATDSGILEEIKSNVPGVYFTQDRLNTIGLDHKRQVQFLSSRLSALKKKDSASDKMLQENILKQVQQSELELKGQQEAERVRNITSLRKERLKASGAVKNSAIQRARAKRYYDQYHLQHHQKLSSRKAREEMLLQGLYRHRLAIQKQQAIDLSKDLRQQEQDQALDMENRLGSLQNFYLGKLEMHREKAQEKTAEKQAQVKAQHQVLEQTRRAIMKQIESEVKEIQENLEKQDDFHFVESDAERLKDLWSKPR